MVRVYTSTDCGQCKTVKKFLDFKHIPYEEVDLTHDFQGAVELQMKSTYAGFPIVEIDGQYMKGYNPRFLMQAAR